MRAALDKSSSLSSKKQDLDLYYKLREEELNTRDLRMQITALREENNRIIHHSEEDKSKMRKEIDELRIKIDKSPRQLNLK